jgi:hypothetical protein
MPAMGFDYIAGSFICGITREVLPGQTANVKSLSVRLLIIAVSQLRLFDRVKIEKKLIQLRFCQN